MSRRFRLLAASTAVAVALGGCTSGTPESARPVDGPMSGVEVAVGGTEEPTDRIMSALIMVAMEMRGAIVFDRSDTPGTALNRDDLVAGRLQVVPEDIGTGWFIHLGRDEDFARTSELAAELRAGDRQNGIEWSDHSGFDDALAAIAEADAATDDNGDPISVDQLANRLGNSFDAVVCVDSETMRSPEGLVRFERATGFTVPAEQLEVRDTAGLIAAVNSGECTVAFVPRIDPAIEAAGLAAISSFAPDGVQQVVFTPRNTAFMFDAEFYQEWSAWLSPFLESLMVTLDDETMIDLKDEFSRTGDAVAVAREHLARNDLL